MDRQDGNARREAEGGLIAVFDANRAALLRFLAARCGDADEAQDVLQDLWVKLCEAKIGPVANGRAYLFRMANNLVLDRRRTQHRAMARDHGWVSEQHGSDVAVEDRTDTSPAADDALASAQEVAILRQAIAELPPGARRALELYRFEERGQAEIAEIMGISRSGVEKHLALAMKKLREALADCGLSGAVASSPQDKARDGGSRMERTP
jgi:RNA polymerase sigma factor (sigma-70 family)